MQLMELCFMIWYMMACGKKKDISFYFERSLLILKEGCFRFKHFFHIDFSFKKINFLMLKNFLNKIQTISHTVSTF